MYLFRQSNVTIKGEELSMEGRGEWGNGGGVWVYVKFGIAVEIENDEIETKTEIWTSFPLLK